MKTLATFALASLALAPLGSQALELNDEFSLAITPTIVSDYRASGISQTLGDPAAQLNLVLTHASGLYAGVWTSNVNFGNDLDTRQELEYYAGYFWQINDNISLDTFFTQYEYPRDSEFNMSDVQSVLDVYGVLLGGKYANNMKGPDYEDENGNWQDGKQNEDLISGFIGYHTVLPAEIGFETRYEHVDYKDDVFFSEDGSSRSTYNNWEVKLTRDLFDITWGLSYVDSDLSKTECLYFSGYDDLCGAAVIASASKTF